MLFYYISLSLSHEIDSLYICKFVTVITTSFILEKNNNRDSARLASYYGVTIIKIATSSEMLLNFWRRQTSRQTSYLGQDFDTRPLSHTIGRYANSKMGDNDRYVCRKWCPFFLRSSATAKKEVEISPDPFHRQDYIYLP